MKKKQLITMGALASLLVTNATQFAYAANTTKDSIGSQNTNDDGINIGVDETQDKKTTYSDSITSDSEQETYVYVSQASTFSVKIPKLIVLSGEKTEEGINKGEYVVSVNGNIGGQETIDVVPSESFAMTQLGKKDIIATVEQEKTSWANNEMDTTSKGVVSTSGMTAGSWNGNFNFDIKLKNENNVEYTNFELNATNLYMLGINAEDTIIDIPETFSYNGTNYKVTSIGYRTFNGNENITKVIVPSTVTSIGAGAFCECTNLKTVNLGNNVETLGESAFECSGITGITIPEKIIVLPASAFQDCHNLSIVQLPDTMTSIKDNAFDGCLSLKTITLPDNIQYIGGDAFNVPNMTSIGYKGILYTTISELETILTDNSVELDNRWIIASSMN